MRAVDTNLLVRLITRDDAKQSAAAEAFISRGAWVSHLVLVETIWVLDAVYDLSAGRIANAVELLLDHRELVLQDPEVVSAALGQFRARPTLGFSDCMVLEIARRAGHLPLGTLDRQLGKLEGTHRV
jgi:predicted nucleic-acid-binding protein